jgi:hypothetical protein
VRARRIDSESKQRPEAPSGAASERGEPLALPATADEALAPLGSQERRFVLALLDSGEPEQAMLAAPYADPRTVADVLGRPHVRLALHRLAPLLPDSRKASRILSPYMLERVSQIATSKGSSDAQAVQAARLVLETAGVGPAAQANESRGLAELVRALSRNGMGAQGGKGKRARELDVTPGRVSSALAPLEPDEPEPH